MALSLTCACGAQFEVGEERAGQMVPCYQCNQLVEAPPLPPPTSPLALASAALALIGAFTLIGSLVAVLLGAVALIQMRLKPGRYTGVRYALFGVVGGLAFTGITLLALRMLDLPSVGDYIRSAQWSGKVRTDGPLEVERPEQGFRLTRPSRQWGVAPENQLDHGVVRALQVQKPDVLLLQTARFAFVDVAVSQSNNNRTLDEFQANLIEELQAARQPDGEQFDAKPNNAPRVTEVKVRSEEKTRREGELERKDCVLDVRIGDQPWVMVVRQCRTRAGRLYTLRGYAARASFDKVKDEMRQLLDSFTVLP